MTVPATKRKPAVQVIPLCRGGVNYHVFTVAADRCSCCGWNRYRR